jgi:hypothetical protein
MAKQKKTTAPIEAPATVETPVVEAPKAKAKPAAKAKAEAKPKAEPKPKADSSAAHAEIKRRIEAETQRRRCLCGCGVVTARAFFVPGHDAKLLSVLLKGEIKQAA